MRISRYVALLAAVLMISSAGTAVAACAPEEDFGSGAITLTFNVGEVAEGDGRYSYSIDKGNSMFRVLEALNVPTHLPTVRSELSVPADPDRVAYDDRYAYILHEAGPGPNASTNLLTIVDVRYPTAPSIVYSGPVHPYSHDGDDIRGLDVSQGFLWTTIGLRVYCLDVSDPANPVNIGYGHGAATPGFGSDFRMVIVGDYVYLASGFGTSMIEMFTLDPYDMNGGWGGELMSEWLLDLSSVFGTAEIYSLAAGKGRDLYISTQQSWEDYSALARYLVGPDGGLTLQALLEDETDYRTYRAYRMVEYGNFLYATTGSAGLRAVSVAGTGLVDVGSVGEFYGPVAVFSNQVGSGANFVNRICDTPVTVPTTGINWYLQPDGGTAVIWNFEWYTDRWTAPAWDMVLVQEPAAYECSLGGVPGLVLKDENSQVGVSVEYDPTNGKFLHRLSYRRDDCTPGCFYNWMALSYRPDSYGVGFGLFKVKLCPVEVPRPPIQVKSPIGPRTQLAAPTPNPFNPMTKLSFYLTDDVGSATLKIHDVKGRLIRSLDTSRSVAGWNELIWDGRSDNGADVPSGVYFAHLVTDSGTSQTRKLMLLK